MERRSSQIVALNDMPLYPSEKNLWDEHLLPSGKTLLLLFFSFQNIFNFNSNADTYKDGCLALPKLNIQFLTMFDYLLRNLNLFHMESTYEIRQVQDTLTTLFQQAFNNNSLPTGN